MSDNVGLPVISGAEAVKAFQKAGWLFSRQVGSHVILKKPNHASRLSIPQHKAIARGTLRGLIKSAGMWLRSSIICYDSKSRFQKFQCWHSNDYSPQN